MSLIDKVKDAAGQVAEQAKHATAVGQQRLDEVRMQKRVDDLYEEVGRLVVASHRGTKPDDFDTQLKGKIVEIDDLEEQIRASAAAAATPPPPPAADRADSTTT